MQPIKKILMKKSILISSAFVLALIVCSCSSSQMSMYKPSDNSPGWRVDVTKKAALPTDEFICKINDSTVMSATFPMIGDSFEKQGTYRGKKVVMSGYRTSTDTRDANGNVTSSDKYQIRVFIDDKLVDKFDF